MLSLGGLDAFDHFTNYNWILIELRIFNMYNFYISEWLWWIEKSLFQMITISRLLISILSSSIPWEKICQMKRYWFLDKLKVLAHIQETLISVKIDYIWFLCLQGSLNKTEKYGEKVKFYECPLYGTKDRHHSDTESSLVTHILLETEVSTDTLLKRGAMLAINT